MMRKEFGLCSVGNGKPYTMLNKENGIRLGIAIQKMDWDALDDGEGKNGIYTNILPQPIRNYN